MSDRKLVALAVVLVLAAFVGYSLLRRAPAAADKRLVAAHVAIEPAAEVATVGPVEIAAGTDFRLHLVLESRDRRDRPLYYTEAKRLRIGDRTVAPESLQRWETDASARVLWFTVEPSRPFVELSADTPLSQPELEEVFRSDWPRSWSLPGSLTPVRETFLPGVEGSPPRERFGVRRFHVRFELFDQESQILPRFSLRSAGAAEAVAAPETFPTLVAALPGALGLPSRLFGAQQIEPGSLPAEERRAALVEITRWMASDLAFARLTLLEGWLTSLGATWNRLSWQAVETDGTAPIGAPGDLLRAGSRWVIYYADRGEIGRLDGDDLCLDFDRGPLVATLGAIFTGEGLIERSRPAAKAGQNGG